MKESISIDQSLHFSDAVFIDVRTPLEFEDGSIPGAYNVALLSNEERVEIGTLYKKEGADRAKERGLELCSPKFPAIYESIKQILQDEAKASSPHDEAKASSPNDKTPILYCWRGGLRSQTVATVLDMVGMDCKIMKSGYQGYRNEVLRVIHGPYPFELITLYGLTGAGKTKLLEKLKSQNLSSLPIVDLEGLACHRGSAFGQIGIPQRQHQKNFEALLFNEIRKYEKFPVVVTEGESRRIGNVLLPHHWMTHMETGRKIFIESTLEKRTQRILDEYFSEINPPKLNEFHQSLKSIERRLGGAMYQILATLLQNGDFSHFVAGILENYYDRNYLHSSNANRNDFDEIFSNNNDQDEQKIVETLRNLCWNGSLTPQTKKS